MLRILFIIYFMALSGVAQSFVNERPVFVIGSGNVGIFTAAAFTSSGFTNVTVVGRREIKNGLDIKILNESGVKQSSIKIKYQALGKLVKFPFNALVIFATPDQGTTDSIAKLEEMNLVGAASMDFVFGQNGLMWDKIQTFCKERRCTRLLFGFGMTASINDDGNGKVQRAAEPKYVLASDNPTFAKALEGTFKNVDIFPSDPTKNFVIVKQSPLRAEFEKVLINAPANGTNTLYGAVSKKWTLGELYDNPTAREIGLNIAREVVLVAEKRQVLIPNDNDKAVIGAVDFWNGDSKLHTTSMAQMYQHNPKAQLEIEPIYDRLIEIANQHGVSVPFLNLMSGALKKMTRGPNNEGIDLVECTKKIFNEGFKDLKSSPCGSLRVQKFLRYDLAHNKCG